MVVIPGQAFPYRVCHADPNEGWKQYSPPKSDRPLRVLNPYRKKFYRKKPLSFNFKFIHENMNRTVFGFVKFKFRLQTETARFIEKCLQISESRIAIFVRKTGLRTSEDCNLQIVYHPHPNCIGQIGS